jgi:hypothetical protein
MGSWSLVVVVLCVFKEQKIKESSTEQLGRRQTLAATRMIQLLSLRLFAPRISNQNG